MKVIIKEGAFDALIEAGKFNPIRSIKAFVRGVKNLVYWLPVIWRDRDYDYHFLLYIMTHKMRGMEKFFESDNTHLCNSEHVARKIKYTRRCLERFHSGHAVHHITMHEEKWGPSEWKLEPVEGSSSVEFKGWIWDKAKTPEKQKQADEELHRAVQRTHASEQLYWSEVWDTIKRYGQGWWD